jgi:20S proteasome subunit beta 4
MKRKHDKTLELTKTSLMVYAGEPGDTLQFSEYIQKNTRLYGLKHQYELKPKQVATFVRKELATSLRSRVF